MSDERVFRRIGVGFCGSVWSSNDSQSHAMKREDGGPGRSLLNDYNVHQKLQRAVFESQSSNRELSVSLPRVCLPACHEFIHHNDQIWWDKQISRFPMEFQIPCNILVTDRITPFPEEVRNNIIDKYCHEPLKLSIKTSFSSEDCLIRPYLGRRRLLVKQSKIQAFSLRNYPLNVDQMEELALNMTLYAEIIAETLAQIYWRAHVDANDVEFVRAPSNPKAKGHVSASPTKPAIINSDVLGAHIMWILDFDCCRHMSFDEDGVHQAVKAFYRNDSFYPRPGADNLRDQTLWNAFKDRFLEASKDLLRLQSVKAHLRVLWIDTIEPRGRH